MRTFIAGFVLLVSQVAFSQQTKFFVKKEGGDLFIEHKVQPKENWYSVGRIYFISPKEIARFNGTTIEKGLSIGQVLKVPLNATNFTQTADASKDGVPVYHAILPKETLFKVVNAYGATAADIKKWNGLSSEQLNAGVELVIGYLKATVSTVQESNPQLLAKPAPIKTEQVPVVATSNTKPKPTVESIPSPEPSRSKSSTEPKPLEESQSKVQVSAPQPNEVRPVMSSPFSALFEQQSREGKQQKIENPVYGIFKSTSGWQDGKYYVLLNNVVPGTIVKIVARSTGKLLFAKVLGAVPAGKESEGMAMRISNATQAALGFTEGSTGNVELYWYN